MNQAAAETFNLFKFLCQEPFDFLKNKIFFKIFRSIINIDHDLTLTVDKFNRVNCTRQNYYFTRSSNPEHVFVRTPMIVREHITNNPVLIVNRIEDLRYAKFYYQHYNKYNYYFPPSKQIQMSFFLSIVYYVFIFSIATLLLPFGLISTIQIYYKIGDYLVENERESFQKFSAIAKKCFFQIMDLILVTFLLMYRIFEIPLKFFTLSWFAHDRDSVARVIIRKCMKFKKDIQIQHDNHITDKDPLNPNPYPSLPANHPVSTSPSPEGSSESKTEMETGGIQLVLVEGAGPSPTINSPLHENQPSSNVYQQLPVVESSLQSWTLFSDFSDQVASKWFQDINLEDFIINTKALKEKTEEANKFYSGEISFEDISQSLECCIFLLYDCFTRRFNDSTEDSDKIIKIYDYISSLKLSPKFRESLEIAINEFERKIGGFLSSDVRDARESLKNIVESDIRYDLKAHEWRYFKNIVPLQYLHQCIRNHINVESHENSQGTKILFNIIKEYVNEDGLHALNTGEKSNCMSKWASECNRRFDQWDSSYISFLYAFRHDTTGTILAFHKSNDGKLEFKDLQEFNTTSANQFGIVEKLAQSFYLFFHCILKLLFLILGFLLTLTYLISILVVAKVYQFVVLTFCSFLFKNFSEDPFDFVSYIKKHGRIEMVLMEKSEICSIDCGMISLEDLYNKKSNEIPFLPELDDIEMNPVNLTKKIEGKKNNYWIINQSKLRTYMDPDFHNCYGIYMNPFEDVDYFFDSMFTIKYSDLYFEMFKFDPNSSYSDSSNRLLQLKIKSFEVGCLFLQYSLLVKSMALTCIIECLLAHSITAYDIYCTLKFFATNLPYEDFKDFLHEGALSSLNFSRLANCAGKVKNVNVLIMFQVNSSLKIIINEIKSGESANQQECKQMSGDINDHKEEKSQNDSQQRGDKMPQSEIEKLEIEKKLMDTTNLNRERVEDFKEIVDLCVSQESMTDVLSLSEFGRKKKIFNKYFIPVLNSVEENMVDSAVFLISSLSNGNFGIHFAGFEASARLKKLSNEYSMRTNSSIYFGNTRFGNW